MANPLVQPPWPLGDRTEFRAAVRRWVVQMWDVDATVRQWWRALADAGLAVPTWPRSSGGLNATVPIQQIIEDELAGASTIAPPQGGVGVRIAAPTLRQHWTPELNARLIPPLIRGEESWCLLLGERPGDTDVAAISTSATAQRDQWRPDAHRWILVGRKELTRETDTARRGLLLARTQPESTDRAGLSCFVLDLRQPGVEFVNAPETADAPARRVLELNDVMITRDDLVGELHEGWQVARTAQSYMRSSLGGRIRRGVIDVPSGDKAGNLDRRIADVLAGRVAAAQPPEHDRRSKRD